MKTRTSGEVASWLYRELIPRFGKPRWVRVDAGKEFAGEVRKLCNSMGITLRVASAGFPRSNGQVERVNREIKAAIRKYAG